jgi:hypothetical protein
VFLIVRGAPGDEPKLKAALEAQLRELGVEALPGVAFPGIVTGQDLVEKSLAIWFRRDGRGHWPVDLCWFSRHWASSASWASWWPRELANLAVRMALGPRDSRVRLMLSDIVKLVIPGVAGGLLLAAVLIRTMET